MELKDQVIANIGNDNYWRDAPRRPWEILKEYSCEVRSELSTVNRALHGTHVSSHRARLVAERRQLVALDRRVTDRLRWIRQHRGSIAPERSPAAVLLSAIAAHRQASQEADLHPEPHDLELWGCLQ